MQATLPLADSPGPIDAEEWRPIEGWPGYEVSNCGHVRSFWGKGSRGEGKGRRGLISEPKLIGGYVWKSGHIMACLYRNGSTEKKFLGVHALVAHAFIGPNPGKMFVRHANGDPGDNRVENLRYGTRRDNTIDAIGHGTHSQASLKEADIPLIWDRLRKGDTARSIGRDLGVSESVIGGIRRGETWTHITKSLPPLKRPGPKAKQKEQYPGPIEAPPELADPSVEQWRPIPGFPAYRVSNLGRVQSRWKRQRHVIGEAWRDRSPNLDVHGYRVFWARNDERIKTLKVHRVVLEAFVGLAPKGYVACHINSDKTDNRLCNLRWWHHRANSIDNIARGASLARLNPDLVREIRDRLASGESQTSIARSLGLGWNTVHNIKKNRIWDWTDSGPKRQRRLILVKDDEQG